MPVHPEREPMEAWGEHANTTQRGISWLAGGWQKKKQSSRTINLSEVSPKHKEAPCFPSGNKHRLENQGSWGRDYIWLQTRIQRVVVKNNQKKITHSDVICETKKVLVFLCVHRLKNNKQHMEVFSIK